MPLSDYSHWNEEAERVWWEEEGKHAEQDAEDWREEEYSAADAFSEELADHDTDHLREMLADKNYCARWPKAVPLIEWELKFRAEYVAPSSH